jgi:hypothetical protein
MNPIVLAIKYAETRLPPGTRYTLNVVDILGKDTNVDVVKLEQGHDLLIRARTKHGHKDALDGEPIFFNPQQVVSVTITVWDEVSRSLKSISHEQA